MRSTGLIEWNQRFSKLPGMSFEGLYEGFSFRAILLRLAIIIQWYLSQYWLHIHMFTFFITICTLTFHSVGLVAQEQPSSESISRPRSPSLSIGLVESSTGPIQNSGESKFQIWTAQWGGCYSGGTLCSWRQLPSIWSLCELSCSMYVEIFSGQKFCQI